MTRRSESKLFLVLAIISATTGLMALAGSFVLKVMHWPGAGLIRAGATILFTIAAVAGAIYFIRWEK